MRFVVLPGQQLFELESKFGQPLIQVGFQQLLLLVGIVGSLLLAPAGFIRLVLVRPKAFELEIVSKGPLVDVKGLRRVGPDWEASIGSDLGWLKRSAAPGKKGNCVIVGRYTLSNGQPGYFARLDEVATGDEIVLYPLRKEFSYFVESVQRLNSLASISPGESEQARLTLVSKISRNNYLVVKAPLIEK